MKNTNVIRLMAWALVMALPMWFSSCKNGGDSTVTPSTSVVEGSWRISGYKINPAIDLGNGQKTNDLLSIYKLYPSGNDIVECLTTTVVTFNSGGKVTGKAGPKCNTTMDDVNPIDDNSTWKLDGSKLTITSGTDVSVYDASVSGNTLKLSSQETEDLDGDGKDETYTYTMELTKV
ncbi:lipocalin family protein [Spirosoma panaciterrae]|uniref:lipocalin family protein n=1 Tax=Spirosoma panaciterrae TaxID=496058 RepID=UPI000372B277|nr:lipocalin family protein [Spirosoma panaciterrae]